MIDEDPAVASEGGNTRVTLTHQLAQHKGLDAAVRRLACHRLNLLLRVHAIITHTFCNAQAARAAQRNGHANAEVGTLSQGELIYRQDEAQEWSAPKVDLGVAPDVDDSSATFGKRLNSVADDHGALAGLHPVLDEPLGAHTAGVGFGKRRCHILEAPPKLEPMVRKPPHRGRDKVLACAAGRPKLWCAPHSPQARVRPWPC